ncbi:MAG: DUF4012 domain-containing protein [Actinomycetota bacterium]
MNEHGSPDAEMSRRVELVAVVATVCIAALVAASSGVEPTGTAAWDSILTAAFAAIVVLAAANCPRWVMIVFASVGAATAGLTGWVVLAWLSLIIALTGAFFLYRNRIAGAVVGALTIQVLLRLPAFGFFGLPTLVVAAACLIVLVTGYGYSSRSTRRFVRWSAAGLIGATAMLTLVGGVALLGARADVERGVGAAQRGLEAARAGEPDVVARELERAEAALLAAESRAGGIAAQGLRLVPIAAQHQHAVEVATVHGARIAREAAAAVREADIENITLRAGEVDLEALRAMAPRLDATAEALTSGSIEISSSQSKWLLPAVSRRIDELLLEVDELLPEAELAAEAAAVVPDLLGASDKRVYFVIFGTPAEAREFGGFLGSWALLEFDQGRISIGDSGRIHEITEVARSNEIPDGVVSDWFLQSARPQMWPQNLTSSPDFRTIAAASTALFDGAFDDELDGFVYLDAWTIAALLDLSGPVEIPFQEAPLDRETAPKFFFEDQYRIEELNRTDLFDGLAGTASEVLRRISDDAELPGPEELGRLLGPLARAGRLQMMTFDERENSFLESVRLFREFESDATDFVALVHSTGTAAKLDLYLERQLSYSVAVTEDGTATATARVTLRSNIPDDAPTLTLGSDGGVNKVLLSLYTPFALSEMRLNGELQGAISGPEFGFWRHLTEVNVPPSGEAMVIEYALSGEVDPDAPYSLTVWHQPLVNTDAASVEYRGPDGELSWQGDLVENLTLSTVEDQ